MKISREYLELTVQDILDYIVKKTPAIAHWGRFNVENVYPPTGRQADRRNWDQEGHFRVMYDGKVIAQLQLKPHKKVTIYELFDHDRYIGKTFENVVHDYLPEARVEVVQDE